jgi:hypothetical protein
MKTWVKVSVSGLVCLVVGVMVGVATAAHFLVTPGQNAYRDFEFSFGRLASRDGVPMPQDEVRKRLTQMLSDNTVSLGLLFDRVDGAQFQGDAVRIAKLIDTDPSLHGPADQWGTQNAATARQCIIEKSSNPPAVVQCVRDSYVPPGPIAHF